MFQLFFPMKRQNTLLRQVNCFKMSIQKFRKIDNPDMNDDANDALANQSNEWKEFLSNLDASTDYAEIHSTDSVPEIT